MAGIRGNDLSKVCILGHPESLRAHAIPRPRPRPNDVLNSLFKRPSHELGAIGPKRGTKSVHHLLSGHAQARQIHHAALAQRVTRHLMQANQVLDGGLW